MHSLPNHRPCGLIFIATALSFQQMCVNFSIFGNNRITLLFPFPPPYATKETGKLKISSHKWVGKKMKVKPVCKTRFVAEKNVLVLQRPHHHSWELSTSLCDTSAATTYIWLWWVLIHTAFNIPPIQIWFLMVLQRGEKVCHPWNHTEAKQRQNQHHPEWVRRLPGSSVWPVDHRFWNRKLGKIQLSSQSTPTLRDTILPPPGSHLKLYSRGRGRETAAPSPPLRLAPRRSQKLQPLPGHLTLPQTEHCGLQHCQAHSCGSKWDSVCLKSPNRCWFPRVQSLNHCKGD